MNLDARIAIASQHPQRNRRVTAPAAR